MTLQWICNLDQDLPVVVATTTTTTMPTAKTTKRTESISSNKKMQLSPSAVCPLVLLVPWTLGRTKNHSSSSHVDQPPPPPPDETPSPTTATTALIRQETDDDDDDLSGSAMGGRSHHNRSIQQQQGKELSVSSPEENVSLYAFSRGSDVPGPIFEDHYHLLRTLRNSWSSSSSSSSPTSTSPDGSNHRSNHDKTGDDYYYDDGISCLTPSLVSRSSSDVRIVLRWRERVRRSLQTVIPFPKLRLLVHSNNNNGNNNRKMLSRECDLDDEDEIDDEVPLSYQLSVNTNDVAATIERSSSPILHRNQSLSPSLQEYMDQVEAPTRRKSGGGGGGNSIQLGSISAQDNASVVSVGLRVSFDNDYPQLVLRMPSMESDQNSEVEEDQEVDDDELFSINDDNNNMLGASFPHPARGPDSPSSSCGRCPPAPTMSPILAIGPMHSNKEERGTAAAPPVGNSPDWFPDNLDHVWIPPFSRPMVTVDLDDSWLLAWGSTTDDEDNGAAGKNDENIHGNDHDSYSYYCRQNYGGRLRPTQVQTQPTDDWNEDNNNDANSNNSKKNSSDHIENEPEQHGTEPPIEGLMRWSLSLVEKGDDADGHPADEDQVSFTSMLSNTLFKPICRVEDEMILLTHLCTATGTIVVPDKNDITQRKNKNATKYYELRLTQPK